MKTRISQAFAAFALTAAVAGFPLCAQPQPADRTADPSSDASPASASAPPDLSGRATVSADLLRHPITGKVRKMLLKAFEKIDAGDHEAAIERLRETLAKHPDSAPYVHNLLGVEYVKTDRFQAAVDSFEQAAALLPRDAMTHYNFGLSLVCAGDYGRAQQEIRRALELDPGNPRTREILAMLEQRHSGN